VLENHILPKLGDRQVRQIRAPEIRDFLLELRRTPSSIQGQKGRDRTPKKTLAKGTMRQVHAILSGLFALAVEEQIITTNPARGLWRRRKTKARRAAPRKVRAMTRDQRDALLAAAADEADVYSAFLIGFLAGLRRGEILGLVWRDVDLKRRRLHVHQQLASRTTKTGMERMVEIATPLAIHLEGLQARRRKDAFRRGVDPMGERVVFPEPASYPPERAYRRLRQVMPRVLKRAGLPGHFTFHSTRHTFCSLLMASGVSPVYVQQQAGHEDVGFTVRVYGSWLPVEQPGAMDALAEGVPVAEPVTNGGSTGNRLPRVSPQTLAPTGTTHPRAGRGPRTP
jgi:integrase